jgi:hypothetical protein
MNAEIEAFCKRHILPRSTRQDLLLAAEEVLVLFNPQLNFAALDLTVDYSEKSGRLGSAVGPDPAHTPAREQNPDFRTVEAAAPFHAESMDHQGSPGEPADATRTCSRSGPC